MRLTRLVTLIALLSSACSFMMNKPPAHVATGEAVSCSSSFGAPIADTVGAVLGLGLGGAILATECSDGSGDGQKCGGNEELILGRAMAIGVLAVGVTYAIAAGLGYRWASTCRDLKDRTTIQLTPTP